MSKLAKALTAAAGNAAGESLYIEDVFSTYLYQGASASKTITNDIDLSGEGGLIWTKRRDGTARTHILVDTERGAGKVLNTDGTYAEYTMTNMPSSFNSDGYTIGTTDAGVNDSSYNYASWTFRKAEKFFDVVTYTGTGVAGNTISHNLGVVPAVIIVKRLDGTGNWAVYHKDADATSPEDKYLFLNSTAAVADAPLWNDYAPTDTDFQVGSYPVVNNSGSPFVAYLFASDAGGFGGDGSESIIKCGSFTLDGSGNASIDCGFEPQWVLAKRTDGAQDWYLTDMMRGMAQTTNGSGTLSPNLSDAEYMYNRPKATATGFDYVFTPNTSYIYIAIRRPMKTPESGTEVFAVDQGDASTTNPQFVSNFPVDLGIWRNIGAGNNWETSSRLQGSNYMRTNLTTAEAPDADIQWDFMTGFYGPARNTSFYSWMFKRATGFFDVVAYTGDGVAGRTVTHNLGVAPEMIILKRRESVRDWGTGFDSLGWTMRGPAINSTEQAYTTSLWWNNTAPTNTEFTLGTSATTNGSSGTYIAYLFATLAGVSKVGSYTGNGTSQTIDCGFSGGSRFILIKRTDSTGDWYVWDSTRGIVASNDPHLSLNTTAAEIATDDSIDPDSSGFIVNQNSATNINVSSASYIYLSIA